MYTSLLGLFFYVVVFFFFSSRRRHTRSDRDWSSDVCSSDLAALYHKNPARLRHDRQVTREVLAVHELVGILAQREHRGVAQVNGDGHLPPDPDSGRNANGFGRLWTGSRVGGDDKQKLRIHGRFGLAV